MDILQVVPQFGDTPATNARLTSQGNTFNMVGTSFNQTGAVFEGVINHNQDVFELTFTFDDLYASPYVPPPPPPPNEQSVGPGWFMFDTT